MSGPIQPGSRERAGPRDLRNFVIVGGGTAGWMAAAALAKVLGVGTRSITLVESEAIGTIGVGEATIPGLPGFHRLLGIDELDFLRATQATFKLAIQFCDWGRIGERFLHPFGPYGVESSHALFQAYWLKRQAEGHPSGLEEWSATGLAASLGRFGIPGPQAPPALRQLSYAYHLDAVLYARFLRSYAENLGVRRVEGMVVEVALGENGNVRSLLLKDGGTVSGDFFLDCSGLEGLIIDKALHAGFEDWSHWLPCDRAVAVQCENTAGLAPVTQSTAREAGWQWRIPLQHRVGNGYVYSSAFLADDAAKATLAQHLEGTALTEPRVLRFKAGRRRKAWVGNCLALGLAAGFLEPLESTSIHLVQSGLGRLFALFPDGDLEPASTAEYNRLTALEYERVRDFLILHYAASRREDAPFWSEVRTMALPESLAYKRDVFIKTGRIAMLDEETFLPPSWLAVYAGMKVWPERHEPLIDIVASKELFARYESTRQAIRSAVETLPVQSVATILNR